MEATRILHSTRDWSGGRAIDVAPHGHPRLCDRSLDRGKVAYFCREIQRRSTIEAPATANLGDRVSFPLESLWNLQGIPPRLIIARTWKALIEDRVFGHAAELGFYFLFALFPTLLCASSILGLAARSAFQFYDKLLDYLAVVIPTAALGTVLSTFNETTAAATSGKVTFGLIAAIWSASVGISAIQDTLNAVYRIDDSRSYFVARIQAIGLTILLTIIVTLGLASMLLGDYYARIAEHRIPNSCCVLRRRLALQVNELDYCQRVAGTDICGALLLGAGLQKEALALAHAGRSGGDCRMAAGVVRPARVPPLLQ